MALSKRHISILALCIYIATICIMCFIRPSSFPDTPMELWGIGVDKFVHFLMFLPFPILAYYSFSKEAKFVILLAGCIFALATECVQGMSEYRSFELGDLAADMLGLISGSTITLIIYKRTNRKHNDK